MIVEAVMSIIFIAAIYGVSSPKNCPQNQIQMTAISFDVLGLCGVAIFWRPALGDSEGMRMNHRIVAALFVAASAAQPIQGAGHILEAQFWSEPSAPDAVPPPPGYPQEWDDDVQPPAPQRVCNKMCANDFSPCDPIYFKTEDGRCDGLDLGR